MDLWIQSGKHCAFCFSKDSLRLIFCDSRPEEDRWFCMSQARLAPLIALPTLITCLFVYLSASAACEQHNYTDQSSSFKSSFPHSWLLRIPEHIDLVNEYHVNACLENWMAVLLAHQWFPYRMSRESTRHMLPPWLHGHAGHGATGAVLQTSS